MVRRTSTEFSSVHHPVMMEEVLEVLQTGNQSLNQPPLVLDGTLGGGGHAEALLKADPESFLVGVDRDPDALQRIKERLEPFQGRHCLFRANFSELELIARRTSEDPAASSFLMHRKNRAEVKFDRVLLDLGISSDQLDSAKRGFSFSLEGPLDMRMERDMPLTAADIVNGQDARAMAKIFQRGGVGSASMALAKAVVEQRPIKNTKQLAELCRSVLLIHKRKANRKSPAKKSSDLATVPFQALRIAVNREVESIQSFLSCICSYLAPGARLAVICFHSLEDQLVAKAMRSWSRPDPIAQKVPQPGIPAVFGRLVSKKAITAKEQEIMNNPRARSARLRVFERSI